MRWLQMNRLTSIANLLRKSNRQWIVKQIIYKSFSPEDTKQLAVDTVAVSSIRHKNIINITHRQTTSSPGSHLQRICLPALSSDLIHSCKILNCDLMHSRKTLNCGLTHSRRTLNSDLIHIHCDLSPQTLCHAKI